uniref:UPF0200/UPF0201 protein AF_1395 n=1 Tax=Archaeoglobus fulgidus (strain ATCC 49558 / DSM 4304 / JCM 9628 / NBRC 100126 / VC-16) TaxID=224325 RepID=UPI00017546D7|nr:Chain A, UPF0200/UPF0201 protein AF_1395 [Archaeoglobus fulgidus DSM 4304]3C9G_B Chain B, UPF0200/UPF0201 protein AF_1395 [Archaeoglobus fulgidus DSM 4304]
SLKLAKNVEIEIRTKIHPTESEDKVLKAIRNIFPDAEIEISEEGEVYGRAYSLDRFRELLRKQRILDTARSEILKGRNGKEVTIYLNKQTATVSRINFCDENAVLSPIKVTFRLNNIPFSRFLDYIAPETKDGRPVKEIDKL